MYKQCTYQNILKIISHQGNAFQNHISQDGEEETQIRTSVGKDWRNQNLHTPPEGTENGATTLEKGLVIP